MPNIRELAKQLGVFPATVSLAMNGKKGVSLALAQKIRKKAFDLGYHKGLKQIWPNRQENSCTVSTLQIIKHGHILGAHHQSFIDGYIMGVMRYAMQYKHLAHDVQLEVKTLHWQQALESNWLPNNSKNSQQRQGLIATRDRGLL